VRSAPRPRLRSLAVAAALTVPLLAVPTAAFAEDAPPAGDVVVGRLTQVVESSAAGRERLSYVDPDDGEPQPVATGQLPAGLAPGATVRVTLGAEVAAGQPARSVLGATVVAPADPVEMIPEPEPVEVSIVQVLPQGTTPDDTTLQDLVDAVTGPVHDYWADETSGPWFDQNGVHVDVTVDRTRGWLSTAYTCAEPGLLAEAAMNSIGWSYGDHRSLLVYLPATATDCPDSYADVGTWYGSGGRIIVRHPSPALIAQQLGIGFGLGTSSRLQCDGTVDSGNCAELPGGDLYDVMGSSWDQLGSLSAPQADSMYWLPPDQLRTVETFSPAATYQLAPWGGRAGLRALELVDRDDQHFWLEFRTATGKDAWLGTTDNTEGLDTGVLLRVTPGRAEPDGYWSYLLDGTPSPESGWDADTEVALPIGAPISVADGEFTIRVTGTSGTGAGVQVTPSGYADPLHVAYRKSGGSDGPMGWRTADRDCGLTRGGCVDEYVGGWIFWSPSSGAHLVNVNDGASTGRWLDGGAEEGPLGYPTTDSQGPLRDNWFFQAFENGSLYTDGNTGDVFEVAGNVRSRWGTLGWEKGPLGYPTDDLVCGLRNGGCFQPFQGGLVYQASAAGTHATWGAVLSRFASWGYEAGPLGYPTADPGCGLPGGGCFQLFQGGSIYWSAVTGAQVVRGALRDRWGALGWERGVLGYPTTSEACGLPGGGCFQQFQGGSLYWSPATGAQLVRGAIRTTWGALGWERGVLGYPTTSEACGLRDGGCFQQFQGGSVYWSARSGAQPIGGALRTAWGAQGWERGALGYPTSAEYPVPGGRAQRFQGGTLTWVAATGRVVRS
jgi:uncharacterized protein with LGFP repeats